MKNKKGTEMGAKGGRGEAAQAEQWDVGTKTDQEKDDGREGSASGPEALARG